MDPQFVKMDLFIVRVIPLVSDFSRVGNRGFRFRIIADGEVTGRGRRSVFVGDLDPPLSGVLDLGVVDLQFVDVDLLFGIDCK